MAFQLRIALFTLLFGTALGQGSRAVLYDKVNANGESLVITSEEFYYSDLSYVDFDNRAYSVCVTGLWLFYEAADFNPDGALGMNFAFGNDMDCVNFRSSVAGAVSSVRYAGNPKDYTADSLTLYQYDYWQGQEEFTYTDLADVVWSRGNHESIIITGKSDWTVYEEPNFQGNSVCLKVRDNGSNMPLMVPDIAEASISHGSIRSIMKGCRSGRIIELN